MFTAGAFLAGLAGGLISPMLSIDPYIGNVFLVRSFFAVTVGGLGQVLAGTLVGSFVIGGSETIFALVSSQVIAQTVVFALAIVLLRFRPTGLVGPIRRSTPAVLPAALAVLLVFAALPQVIEGYAIYILPQYMLFGVWRCRSAILWGSCGILSFGQAGFFALGGYAMGLAIGQEWAWLNGGYLGILVAVAVCAVVAAAIGYFLFSAGVRDSYFVLVTLALSIMVEQIAVSQSEITGGWNGMYIDRLTLGPLELTEDAPIYYVMLAVAALVYARPPLRFSPPASARFWSGSGRTNPGWRRWATPRRCTRRQPSRFRPGSPALPVPSTPPTRVSSPPRWVACYSPPRSWSGWPSAGRDSLLAAFLGGLLVPSLSNYLSAISPSLWQLFMGGLFIAAITLFRGGVAGFLGRLASRWGRGP